MKVILLKTMPKLGKEGEIINVNDGYARNYVLPQKLGVEATPDNLNKLKLKKAAEAKKAAEDLAAAKAQAEELKDKFVETTMKVGKDGRAFGSVSTKEVADLLKKQLHFEIDKKKISLDVPAKSLGNFKVTIKLHPEVNAEVTLRVVEA